MHERVVIEMANGNVATSNGMGIHDIRNTSIGSQKLSVDVPQSGKPNFLLLLGESIRCTRILSSGVHIN